MYVAMRAINLLPSLLNPITSSALYKIPPITVTSTVRLCSSNKGKETKESSTSGLPIAVSKGIFKKILHVE